MDYYGKQLIDKPIIAQQGWQCPICGRVYSPMTFMCYYCGGEQKIETSTDTDTQVKTRLSYM